MALASVDEALLATLTEITSARSRCSRIGKPLWVEQNSLAAWNTATNHERDSEL